MKIRAFITHKKAEHFKDCQDRFSINIDTKSVAVSDGMSQSYQQKIWAELLVNAYTDNIEWVPNIESVKELAPLWDAKVRNFIQKLKDNNAPQYLVIMNENALAQRKSAGATFCGIRFDHNNWSGDVLGDTCLIEIVKNRIQKLYTSQSGDEFDNHPDYFDSNPLNIGKGKPLAIEGTLDKSTTIIIVSDPFTDFLNEKQKLGNEEVFVEQLLAITNHDEFEKLVADWRDNYNMHNDDTTLIIIEYDGDSDFNVVSHDMIDVYIAEDNPPEQAQNDASRASEKFEEEKRTDGQEGQNAQIASKIMDENFEPLPVFDNKVSVDDFIQTGIEQYEKIKLECKCGIFRAYCSNDDVDILKETLKVLYKLYFDI
jgi:hypothetical protein